MPEDISKQLCEIVNDLNSIRPLKEKLFYQNTLDDLLKTLSVGYKNFFPNGYMAVGAGYLVDKDEKSYTIYGYYKKDWMAIMKPGKAIPLKTLMPEPAKKWVIPAEELDSYMKPNLPVKD